MHDRTMHDGRDPITIFAEAPVFAGQSLRAAAERRNMEPEALAVYLSRVPAQIQRVIDAADIMISVADDVAGNCESAMFGAKEGSD